MTEEKRIDADAVLTSIIPRLPSLDIPRSVAFYEKTLRFVRARQDDDFAILRRDTVEIHLWKCADRHIAESSGCRINVEGIEILHRLCEPHGIVHPNGRLETKPWGFKEFAILDPDGNLITFAERVRAQGVGA